MCMYCMYIDKAFLDIYMCTVYIHVTHIIYSIILYTYSTYCSTTKLHVYTSCIYPPWISDGLFHFKIE